MLPSATMMEPCGRRGNTAAGTTRKRSPDADAIIRLEEELVARFDIPGVIPSVDVAHGPVDAELRRRMGVGRHLPLERIGAALRAPDLRPTEKHALIAREAIEN